MVTPVILPRVMAAGQRGPPETRPGPRGKDRASVSLSPTGIISEVPPCPLPELPGPGRHGQKCGHPQVSVHLWGVTLESWDRWLVEGSWGPHRSVSWTLVTKGRHRCRERPRSRALPSPRAHPAPTPTPVDPERPCSPRAGQGHLHVSSSPPCAPGSLPEPAPPTPCRPRPAACFCPATSRTSTCCSSCAAQMMSAPGWRRKS